MTREHPRSLTRKLSPMLEGAADTRFVELDGLRLRVAVEGEGPPLLMCNGIGANIEVWSPLTRLMSGRQLILFDAPGAGASAPPPRPLRIRDIANAGASLLGCLGVQRADVLGYSWGGALAQELAHRHPARVARLILAGTTPGLGAVQNPARVLRLFDPRLQDADAEAHRAATVPGLVGGRSSRDPAAFATYERNRMAHPPSREGYRFQLRALSGWSSMRWLRTLEMPTLVLAGEEDPLVPLINSRMFTRRMPNCRRYVVRGGGHLFMIDQPGDVAGVIDAFLSDPAVASPPPATRRVGSS